MAGQNQEAFLMLKAWQSLDLIDPAVYSFDHNSYPGFHVTLRVEFKEHTVMIEEDAPPIVVSAFELPSITKVFLINVNELTNQPTSNWHITTMLVSMSVPLEIQQQLLPWLEEFFLRTAAANTRRMVIPVFIQLSVTLNTIFDDNSFEEMLYAGLHSDTDISDSDSDSDNADQSNVPKIVPADPSSVKALKMETFDESISSKECTICLEDYIVGVELLHMPCSHVFHRECLTKWLETSNVCPLCKYEMPIKED